MVSMMLDGNVLRPRLIIFTDAFVRENAVRGNDDVTTLWRSKIYKRRHFFENSSVRKW